MQSNGRVALYLMPPKKPLVYTVGILLGFSLVKGRGVALEYAVRLISFAEA